MIHSRKQRADGSWNIRYYCRPCQAARVYRQKTNQKFGLKEYKYSETVARESYLRISEKYASTGTRHNAKPKVEL